MKINNRIIKYNKYNPLKISKERLIDDRLVIYKNQYWDFSKWIILQILIKLIFLYPALMFKLEKEITN